MTLTLDVPPDVKNGLEAKAARMGVSLDLYVLEVGSDGGRIIVEETLNALSELWD